MDPGTGAAAAVAAEEDEEGGGGGGWGEQKEGGGQAATGSQAADSSSMSTKMSFLPGRATGSRATGSQEELEPIPATELSPDGGTDEARQDGARRLKVVGGHFPPGADGVTIQTPIALLWFCWIHPVLA
ncbi:hypothetical protein Q5P01_013567 [Channa striata]|uniref:Uncharacterized protein n=1 Tax=Channa striata TaxID=64152 RepID=A0AA88MMQ5_CHASR|nr:hypothetical protein Q5P01_013567 [Channa striata]